MGCERRAYHGARVNHMCQRVLRPLHHAAHLYMPCDLAEDVCIQVNHNIPRGSTHPPPPAPPSYLPVATTELQLTFEPLNQLKHRE